MLEMMPIFETHPISGESSKKRRHDDSSSDERILKKKNLVKNRADQVKKKRDYENALSSTKQSRMFEK